MVVIFGGASASMAALSCAREVVPAPCKLSSLYRTLIAVVAVALGITSVVIRKIVAVADVVMSAPLLIY